MVKTRRTKRTTITMTIRRTRRRRCDIFSSRLCGLCSLNVFITHSKAMGRPRKRMGRGPSALDKSKKATARGRLSLKQRWPWARSRRFTRNCLRGILLSSESHCRLATYRGRNAPCGCDTAGGYWATTEAPLIRGTASTEFPSDSRRHRRGQTCPVSPHG